MVAVVDRDDNVVLTKKIHLVGPSTDHLVSLLRFIRRGQTGVKHAVKHMDGRRLGWLQLRGGEVLDLQVNEIVVQIFLRSQLLQIALEDCDGILEAGKVIGKHSHK